MLDLADIIEIAMLLLLAYCAGCGAGYGMHLLLVRLRTPRPLKTPEPIVVQAEPAPRPRPSPAARLAMTVTTEDPAPLATATAPARIPPPVEDPRPAALPSPRGGIGDDLRQIKGVGPKIEALLHELGVFHYDQIAAWTEANCQWVDLKLGFKGRVARERWVAQAEALVDPEQRVPRKVA